jgi:hypothetical protein
VYTEGNYTRRQFITPLPDLHVDENENCNSVFFALILDGMKKTINELSVSIRIYSRLNYVSGQNAYGNDTDFFRSDE